jgi:hypothetical protein
MIDLLHHEEFHHHNLAATKLTVTTHSNVSNAACHNYQLPARKRNVKAVRRPLPIAQIYPFGRTTLKKAYFSME